MMGPTHRFVGAVSGAAYGHIIGADAGTVLVTTILAAQFSAGKATSPDLDLSGPWKWAARHTPAFMDPLFAHRFGLTHWWGLPVIAWPLIVAMPAHLQVPFTAMLVGWVSHLVSDAPFGQLRLWPWGGPRFGTKLDTNGFAETGRLKIGGRVLWWKFKPRVVRVVPFGPVRLVMGLGLGLLVFAPTVVEVYHSIVIR